MRTVKESIEIIFNYLTKLINLNISQTELYYDRILLNKEEFDCDVLSRDKFIVDSYNVEPINIDIPLELDKIFEEFDENIDLYIYKIMCPINTNYRRNMNKLYEEITTSLNDPFSEIMFLWKDLKERMIMYNKFKYTHNDEVFYELKKEIHEITEKINIYHTNLYKFISNEKSDEVFIGDCTLELNKIIDELIALDENHPNKEEINSIKIYSSPYLGEK
jgi:hypothetical protein